jgi:hypothetical protein
MKDAEGVVAVRPKELPYLENKETGEKTEAGSALQLAKKIGIHYSVIHEELNRHEYAKITKGKTKVSKYYDFLQKHKIYYRDK